MPCYLLSTKSPTRQPYRMIIHPYTSIRRDFFLDFWMSGPRRYLAVISRITAGPSMMCLADLPGKAVVIRLPAI